MQFYASVSWANEIFGRTVPLCSTNNFILGRQKAVAGGF